MEVWTNGNPMALQVHGEGNGTRPAYSVDSSDQPPARLLITYTTNTQVVTINTRYDALSRPISATYSGAYSYTFLYDYDKVGNRQAQTRTITSTVVTTYTYDAANQLVTAKASNDATVWYYAYDTNGNLREMTPNGTNPANGAIRYSYDAANRMTKLETHNGSSYSVLAQMAYDGLGNRAQLVGWVSGVPYTTTYATRIVGQVQILQAGSGGITTTYWYGVGSIGEFGSSTSYYLVDGNGSVRQAVDQNANVVFARYYDPFGQMLNQNGTGDTLYGYLGGQFDQVIGLMYIDGRYYDPITGRFLSPSTGGQNPYVPFASLSFAPFILIAVLRRRKKGQIWTGWLVIAVMASIGLGIAACGGTPTPQTKPPGIGLSTRPSKTGTPVSNLSPIPETPTAIPLTPILLACPEPPSTPTPVPTPSNADVIATARAAALEAGGLGIWVSDENRNSVLTDLAWVVRNRIGTAGFGCDTAEQCASDTGQFNAVARNPSYMPTENEQNIARAALTAPAGTDPSNGSVYFHSFDALPGPYRQLVVANPNNAYGFYFYTSAQCPGGPRGGGVGCSFVPTPTPSQSPTPQ